MNYHGLTEQIPQGVQALTTHKVVTPSMRSRRGASKPTKHAWVVQGIRYEYTTSKPESDLPVRALQGHADPGRQNLQELTRPPLFEAAASASSRAANGPCHLPLRWPACGCIPLPLLQKEQVDR
jgi:hypothetical protein